VLAAIGVCSDTPQQHWQRGGTLAAAAEVLGPVFARHGYVFLFPFRRGEGHNFLYTNVPLWENDVFAFLDEHTKR
jgi:hypothetical protein